MLALLTTLALSTPATTPLPFEAPALAALYAPQSDDRDFHFSYTYIQVGYSATKLDKINDDATGLRGRASVGLLGFLYVFLDYANQTTDYQDSKSDSYGLGAGAHFALRPNLDLVGEASWLSNDISSDLSTLDESNNGWSAFAGARLLAMPWEGGGLEWNGGFRWIDLKGFASDDRTGAWEVGARAHFLGHLSVGASYTFLEQDRQWGLDARLSF